MKFTYYRPAELNLKECDNITGKLILDFNTLCSEKVDELEIYYYVWNLAKAAKSLERRPEMSFFGYDEPGHMPSDARVDYFYLPTYYATAFMVKAVLLHPELLTGMVWEFSDECVAALKESLPACLLGCTGRNFMGHGFDGTKGFLETLRIFGKADMKAFIEKHPEICPTFNEKYKEAINHLYMRAVVDGEYKGGWGEDYTEEALKVLRINMIS